MDPGRSWKAPAWIVLKSKMIDEGRRSGHLLDNLVLFGRVLRELGISVDTGLLISLVHALEHINIGRRADFYHALRCLMVHSRREIDLFDQAFAAFWKKSGTARFELNIPGGSSLPRGKDPSSPTPSSRLNAVKSIQDQSSESGDDSLLTEVTQTYSQREVLRHKDFAEMNHEEIQAVIQLMADLAWRLGFRRSRRMQPGSGPQADFRRSIRHNLRFGGELLQWSHRQPKLKPRSLVILADISGSMERYTNLLLHFAYVMTRGLEQAVEAFVFSTRLTRISRQLRVGSAVEAMQEVSRDVSDWSGGTRIGDAIKVFNYQWARRVLARGAVVLLISDGWDRGDPQMLRGEIARLQRSCHRLIWLNPLLGSPQYEPLTRGMQASLPFIDDFLPVHSLASLEDLARHLSQLKETRPVRRHQNWSILGTQASGAISL